MPNSSKSVKPRPKYGDLSIFQDGGRRRLVFQSAKFGRNRSNSCGDMAISIFQDGGRPPSWISCVGYWTTQEGCLVVYITV